MPQVGEPRRAPRCLRQSAQRAPTSSRWLLAPLDLRPVPPSCHHLAAQAAHDASRQLPSAAPTPWILPCGSRRQRRSLHRSLGVHLRAVRPDRASLAAVEAAVAGEALFVLLTTDYVFAEGALDRLLGAAEPAVLVDPAPDRAAWQEGCKVRILDGAAVAFGKHLDEPAIDCGAFLLPPEVFGCQRQAAAEGDHTLAGAVTRLTRARPLWAIPLTAGCWWQDVDTPQDARAAVAALRRSLGKDTDGPVSRFINRPLSTRLSMLLAPLRPPPDLVSLVAFALGLAGAALLSMATKDRAAAPGLPPAPERALGWLLGGRDGRLLLVAVGALLGAPIAALAAVTPPRRCRLACGSPSCAARRAAEPSTSSPGAWGPLRPGSWVGDSGPDRVATRSRAGRRVWCEGLGGRCRGSCDRSPRLGGRGQGPPRRSPAPRWSRPTMCAPPPDRTATPGWRRLRLPVVDGQRGPARQLCCLRRRRSAPPGHPRPGSGGGHHL
jgi:hypothetical protein